MERSLKYVFFGDWNLILQDIQCNVDDEKVIFLFKEENRYSVKWVLKVVPYFTTITGNEKDEDSEEIAYITHIYGDKELFIGSTIDDFSERIINIACDEWNIIHTFYNQKGEFNIKWRFKKINAKNEYYLSGKGIKFFME